MNAPLKPRSIAILRIVDTLTRQLGYAPSFEEIAAEAAVAKSTIAHHVGRLETYGFVARVAGRPRALTVTSAGRSALADSNQRGG